MSPEPTASGPCLRSILMADIVSSTALYERLGNVAAMKMVGDRLAAIGQVVELHEGRVVKSLGDGLLCCFASHEQAVRAAIRLCHSEASELEIRVGVCCGEIVEEGDDVFGDAVNTAARIMALAKPSEVLISFKATEALPPYMKGIARYVSALSVKGKHEPIEVYAILERDMQPEAGLPTVSSSGHPRIETTRLELTYFEQRLLVSLGEELGMGRDAESDLLVTGPYVSRHHARIFHRQGKFVLVDQSANGTYLVPRDQPMLHLRREEAILHDAGSIYLGADPTVADSEPVRYRTK